MSDAALAATADALARRALGALPEAPTRDDLAALAPPLARLLSARLDAEFDRAAPASDWVDADATADARAAWLEAAAPTLRVPAGQRQSVVERATERALTHLVRPAQTLAAVAFEGETGPMPIDRALARIRAFGPYPYLVQIAERYAERKALSHIDRAGLERLLLRIDRRMVSAFDAADWMTLLQPMLDWVGPSGRPPGTVPADLLRMLFQAKGATALADALEGIGTVEVPTLHGLIATALSETSALPTPSEAQPPTPAAEASPAEPLESSSTSLPDVGARGDASAEPKRDEGIPLPDRDTDPEPDAPDSTAPPLAPPAERQPGPWEEDEEVTLGPPSEPAPEQSPGPEAESELPTPPVIGSRYATPEFDSVDNSDVLGPPRPVAPMEAVRDADAEPDSAEPNGEAPTPEGTAPQPPALDAEPPEQELSPSAAASASAAVDEEPLWQRLAREQGETAAPPPEVTDEDEPLWKRFAQSDLAERLPEPDVAESTPDRSPSPARTATRSLFLEDLEAKVLGDDAYERRDWYVTELFGGSPSEYHRTLTAIDAAASYTDATAIISSEILKKRSVSPYTDCAVAFIDAVQDQFESR